ncbi:MAG TPA: CAP domain-containing protein, partial [Candidatus Saccharimonadales bacterium]|nr:CAP domain-containing protein [Candidatus Saccharimonadales bacterium]
MTTCAVISAFSGSAAYAQAIAHQITLPAGYSWCDDSMINGLFTQINTLRSQKGLPALAQDATGMKDAELRAVQVAQYMAASGPGTPGFNPHQGYDTTAAGVGYSLVGENIAYYTSDPNYIVYGVWQDPLHLAAMLSSTANVAGVACVFDAGGTPYWTYEPGVAQNVSTPPAPPSQPSNPSSPSGPSTGSGSGSGTPPAGASSTLDSEESAFVTLINNYRAQNGVGPLQVS